MMPILQKAIFDYIFMKMQLNFHWNFTEICSQGSYSQSGSISAEMVWCLSGNKPLSFMYILLHGMTFLED